MKGYKHLTYADRYTIYNCLKRKIGIRAIARLLDRNPASISREIKRGSCEQMDSIGNISLRYDPYYAQKVHNIACQNKGPGVKIGSDYKTAQRLEYLIKKERYSPYAALVRMKEEGTLITSLCVGTIYNYIRHGVLDIEERHLIYGFTKRKPKKKEWDERKDIPHKNGGKSIKKRPLSVLNRKDFGHWEADLIVSARPGKSAIFTLVERKTRMLIAVKIQRKSQDEVRRALDQIELMFGTDAEKAFKSITYDNGIEFNNARAMMRSGFTKRNRIKEIYYAHPYSSGERGTNENTNRMLRRFIPKKANMDLITNEDVQTYVKWINTYPRAIFHGRCAEDAFQSEIDQASIRFCAAA